VAALGAARPFELSASREDAIVMVHEVAGTASVQPSAIPAPSGVVISDSGALARIIDMRVVDEALLVLDARTDPHLARLDIATGRVTHRFGTNVNSRGPLLRPFSFYLAGDRGSVVDVYDAAADVLV